MLSTPQGSPCHTGGPPHAARETLSGVCGPTALPSLECIQIFSTARNPTTSWPPLSPYSDTPTALASRSTSPRHPQALSLTSSRWPLTDSAPSPHLLLICLPCISPFQLVYLFPGCLLLLGMAWGLQIPKDPCIEFWGSVSVDGKKITFLFPSSLVKIEHLLPLCMSAGNHSSCQRIRGSVTRRKCRSFQIILCCSRNLEISFILNPTSKGW